jgi:hypothetical protein
MCYIKPIYCNCGRWALFLQVLVFFNAEHQLTNSTKRSTGEARDRSGNVSENGLKPHSLRNDLTGLTNAALIA